jgi:hypothetical protein
MSGLLLSIGYVPANFFHGFIPRHYRGHRTLFRGATIPDFAGNAIIDNYATAMPERKIQNLSQYNQREYKSFGPVRGII